MISKKLFESFGTLYLYRILLLECYNWFKLFWKRRWLSITFQTQETIPYHKWNRCSLVYSISVLFTQKMKNILVALCMPFLFTKRDAWAKTRPYSLIPVWLIMRRSRVSQLWSLLFLKKKEGHRNLWKNMSSVLRRIVSPT